MLIRFTSSYPVVAEFKAAVPDRPASQQTLSTTVCYNGTRWAAEAIWFAPTTSFSTRPQPVRDGAVGGTTNVNHTAVTRPRNLLFARQRKVAFRISSHILLPFRNPTSLSYWIICWMIAAFAMLLSPFCTMFVSILSVWEHTHRSSQYFPIRVQTFYDRNAFSVVSACFIAMRHKRGICCGRSVLLPVCPTHSLTS